MNNKMNTSCTGEKMKSNFYKNLSASVGGGVC